MRTQRIEFIDKFALDRSVDTPPFGVNDQRVAARHRNDGSGAPTEPMSKPELTVDWIAILLLRREDILVRDETGMFGRHQPPRPLIAEMKPAGKIVIDDGFEGW